MFWRKRTKPIAQTPGITGTGKFIYNNGWTLWDDARSPGLIGAEKLGELESLVLSQQERSILARYTIADSIARSPKHSAAEEQEAAAIFEKLNAYLVDIRHNRFDQLTEWLEFNLMRDEVGRVVREDGTRAANYMLSPVEAYLNCLSLWGYGYRWEHVGNSQGETALLIHRPHRTSRIINQSEVEYIQGRPYRFVIQMREASWRFEVQTGYFDISARGRHGTDIF